MRSSKRGKSFGRCDSCQEAARKGYQQGAEGPEKGKGWKPEGKALVILLMLMSPDYLAAKDQLSPESQQQLALQHQQNKLGIAALADSTIDCTNYTCL